MKTEDEIQDRIRQLLAEEFARRLEEASERLPHRCVHNHRQPLDNRRHIDGEPNPGYNRIAHHGLPVVQTIGLCMYGSNNPEEWNGTICEEPIDAQRCPLFEPTLSKDDLNKEYEEHLKDSVWVREHLPEVNGLLWAISSESLPEPKSIPEPTPEPEPDVWEPRRRHWFVRFILWLGGSRRPQLPSGRS